MKRIEVVIEGVTPLLMNSPRAMLDEKNKLRKTTKEYDNKAEAEKVAYRNAQGRLYVPSEAIRGCIIGASSFKKIGKYALKSIIASAVSVEQQEVLLDNTEYEIDLRTVVIQKNRVIKARPRIDNWKLKFNLAIDEQLIANNDIVKQVLEEAGMRVGILDFRPQKLGIFGKFKVIQWKVL